MGFHFSASQIETFRDCPRKWGFQKLDKIETPPHPAAELGSAAHLLREDWLLKGVLPPTDSLAGRLARVGIETLPPPGTCEVEKEVNLPTEAGFCKGRIDFFILDQSLSPFSSPSLPKVKGVPLVGDHKTTSNRNWIKTPEYLSNGDAQATIYAQFAFDSSPSPFVDLFWAYMVKSSPFPTSQSVFARVERVPTQDKFLRIVEEAKEMRVFFDKDGIRANDLPFDSSACDKYGGCPFKNNCTKGKFMPNSSKNSNILGVKSPGSSENSLIQKLSSTPPPITVEVSPPDAPLPSYTYVKEEDTHPSSQIALEVNQKVVSSLETIQKEIGSLISHFKSQRGKND